MSIASRRVKWSCATSAAGLFTGMARVSGPEDRTAHEGTGKQSYKEGTQKDPKVQQ